MAAHAPTMPVPLAPEWLAHRYDPEHDAVHFIPAARALRRDITFLTDEYLPRDLQPVMMRRQDALAAAPAAAPLHFIFHSAFCCSTLLANGFDRDGVATSLKEPVILNDLVGWRRRGGPGGHVATVLDSALTLLARPFAHGEAVIVKPSNVLSGLIPAMLSMRPDAKALLLHAPLPVFLTSVAKKGLDGRLWVRELFLGFRTDELVQSLGFDDKAFFGQTDLQIAAIGWLAQQALFAGLIEKLTAARVRSLDSETLLAEPEAALAALGAFYGLALSDADIAAIMAGPFRRNAKSGAAFDAGDRTAEYRAAGDMHRDEIEKVTRWAEVVASGAGIPMTLGASLI